MTSFNIYSQDDPQNPLGTIEAADAIEALAEYAMSMGYADPREAVDALDLFYRDFDGTQVMTFENTELVAVPS